MFRLGRRQGPWPWPHPDTWTPHPTGTYWVRSRARCSQRRWPRVPPQTMFGPETQDVPDGKWIPKSFETAPPFEVVFSFSPGLRSPSGTTRERVRRRVPGSLFVRRKGAWQRSGRAPTEPRSAYRLRDAGGIQPDSSISTSVAPVPPRLPGGCLKDLTAGCSRQTSATIRRSVPVPWPCTIRIVRLPAAKA